MHNNSKCIIFALEIGCKGTPFFQNMQEKMKKNDTRFKLFVENVATKDISLVRKYIMYYCKISKSCYYKWLGGGSTPCVRRRVYINGIAFKFGYPIVYPHVKGYCEQPKLIAIWKQD